VTLGCGGDEKTARRYLVVAVLASAIAFLILAVAVALHPQPIRIERGVAGAISAPRDSAWFDVFRIVTTAGSYAFVATGAAVLAVESWIRTRDLRLAIACVLAPGLAGLAEVVLKPIVGRPRPATSVATGQPRFGFPSGHASGATALGVCAVVAAWTVWSSRRVRAWTLVGFAVYVIVIGVSRVVVGAHYAGDVIGGWLLGAAIAGATIDVLNPRCRVASARSRRSSC
jgi:membrane-associated phospholipid phosphatase